MTYGRHLGNALIACLIVMGWTGMATGGSEEIPAPEGPLVVAELHGEVSANGVALRAGQGIDGGLLEAKGPAAWVRLRLDDESELLIAGGATRLRIGADTAAGLGGLPSDLAGEGGNSLYLDVESGSLFLRSSEGEAPIKRKFVISTGDLDVLINQGSAMVAVDREGTLVYDCSGRARLASSPLQPRENAWSRDSSAHSFWRAGGGAQATEHDPSPADQQLAREGFARLDLDIGACGGGT